MIPFIRRIRVSEIEILTQFLLSPNAEQPPFEHHDIWLRRVLEEFESGVSRVVFGAFYPNSRKAGKYELIGVLFLKRSEFDDTIELKSLVTATISYLHSDCFNLDNSIDSKSVICKALVEKAILFCEMREFPRIEMELLQNEMKSEVRLLHDLGFKISYLREKYKAGKLIYVFEKNIGDIYQADPFNEIKLARWFIQRIFPSKIFNDKSIDFDNFNVTIIPFEREKIVQYYTNSDNLVMYQLKGEVAIIRFSKKKDVNIANISSIFSKDVQLRMLIINFDIENKKNEDLKKDNIHLITESFLKLFAGGSKSSLSIPYEISEIGGALTVLEKETIEQYKSYKEFAYFLISGLGNALHVSEEYGLILAIYCPYWLNDIYGRIVGYCKVSAKAMTTFDNAFSVFPDIPQALTKRDINYYKKLSNENDEFPVLKCSAINFFEEPLTLFEFEKLFKTDYLEKQLEINLNSSAYLSIETCKKLKELKVKTNNDEVNLLDSVKSVYVMYSSDITKSLADYVTILVEYLKNNGINVIYDKISLKGGDPKGDTLLKLMQSCNIFILICDEYFPLRISNPGHFLYSEFMELKNAIKVKNDCIRVIPILIDQKIELNHTLNYYHPVYKDHFNNATSLGRHLMHLITS